MSRYKASVQLTTNLVHIHKHISCLVVAIGKYSSMQSCEIFCLWKSQKCKCLYKGSCGCHELNESSKCPGLSISEMEILKDRDGHSQKSACYYIYNAIQWQTQTFEQMYPWRADIFPLTTTAFPVAYPVCGTCVCVCVCVCCVCTCVYVYL